MNPPQVRAIITFAAGRGGRVDHGVGKRQDQDLDRVCDHKMTAVVTITAIRCDRGSAVCYNPAVQAMPIATIVTSA